jgi:hypothetical protein
MFLRIRRYGDAWERRCGVKINKVYLVGAGPSRSLITVKGLEILRQARE